jgi:hypothetical protein
MVGQDIGGTIAAAPSTGIATWVIPATSSTITFDGNVTTHPGVTGPSRAAQSGDIIELNPGTHGRRNFVNIIGTSVNRVRIRNGSGGQAVMRSPSLMVGSFVNTVKNCHHCDFIGDNSNSAPLHPTVPGVRLGFKFMYSSAAQAQSGLRDAPTALLKLQATNSTSKPSSDCTFSHFECDGGWHENPAQSFADDGIGVQLQDQSVLMSANPGVFQENIKLLNFVWRNCEGEGGYLGPNYALGVVPLRNIEVAYGYTDMTGGDAINAKSWFEGNNSIHDCIVERAARDTTPSGTPGCIALLSSAATVYNCVVKDGGVVGGPANNGHGIRFYVQNGPPASSSPAAGYPTYPTLAATVYNCVSLRARVADGITAGSQSSSTLSKQVVKIYNCTTLDNADEGISVGSQAHSTSFVRNCISLGNATQINAGSFSQVANTTTGTPSSIFVNYANDDLHLTAPIAVTGTPGVDVATFDIEGKSRPQGATSDRGAYEYP